MWIAWLYGAYYIVLATAVALYSSAYHQTWAAPVCVIAILVSHFVLGGVEAAQNFAKAKVRYSGEHGGLNACTDLLLTASLGFSVAWLVSVWPNAPTVHTPWLAALALNNAIIGNGGCLWVRVSESKSHNRAPANRLYTGLLNP
jgi:hypothetical protein